MAVRLFSRSTSVVSSLATSNKAEEAGVDGEPVGDFDMQEDDVAGLLMWSRRLLRVGGVGTTASLRFHGAELYTERREHFRGDIIYALHVFLTHPSHLLIFFWFKEAYAIVLIVLCDIHYLSAVVCMRTIYVLTFFVKKGFETI
uniref:7TM_GPCR_Srx domain-containing protein n=1 Tax=Steinernema glaseri TaxID=37863 RepID=A0A1I7ZSS8_9BILA